MDWTYGVKIVRDGADFVATTRDLPEVLKSGRSPEKARRLATDAVDAAVAHRIAKGKALAAPSPVEEGEAAVELPLQTATKATLNLAWRKSGLSKMEVARRMGVQESEVRRILNPRHGTRLGTIEAAAKVLGARITINMTL